MSRKNRVSPDVFENIKSNIAELEDNGTEKQKEIIRNEFGYIKKAGSISGSTARHIARRLEIDFKALCSHHDEHPFTVTGMDEALNSEKHEAEPEKTDEKVEENVEEKVEEKTEEKADAMSLFVAFLKYTKMKSSYAAECFGISPAGISHAKSGKAPAVASMISEAMDAMPKTEEEMKKEDPEKLISMFEKGAESVKNKREAEKIKKATEKRKAKENAKKENAKKGIKEIVPPLNSKKEEKVEEKVEEKKEEEKAETNLDFYSNLIIKNANDFIRNGKQTAARATVNAMRAFIPDSADTPEKVIDWLKAVHVDRFVLSEAEMAMVDGYFKLHKNAITTLFSDTYMYSAKAESGLFAGVPGDITLEYLREHAVTRGGANG